MRRSRIPVVAGSGGNIVGSNTAQGALYVFVKPASGWTNMTQTAKLTNSAGQASDELGLSVAISGNTLVGGAPGVSGGPGPAVGAAYLFRTRNGIRGRASSGRCAMNADVEYFNPNPHVVRTLTVSEDELIRLQDLVDDEAKAQPQLRFLQRRLHQMTGEPMPPHD